MTNEDRPVARPSDELQAKGRTLVEEAARELEGKQPIEALGEEEAVVSYQAMCFACDHDAILNLVPDASIYNLVLLVARSILNYKEKGL